MTRKLNNISLKESMLNVQIRPALLCEMDAMALIKASFLSRITRKCKIRNEIMSNKNVRELVGIRANPAFKGLDI